MDLPRLNLHSHSNFSDGRTSIKKIAEKARMINLDYLAITDHFSNSWKAKVISTLDNKAKIDQYLKKIKSIKQKNKDKNVNLKIFKGIEIDIGSSEEFIMNLIDPEKYDLILFEYLETMEGINFVQNLIDNWKKILKNSGNIEFPILGLAHFDPSFFILLNLEELLSFLKRNNIYFEFNSRYSGYYSARNKEFFQALTEYGINVAIGSDSHDLKRLDDIEAPLEMIRHYHLEDQLLTLIAELDKKFKSKTQ